MKKKLFPEHKETIQAWLQQGLSVGEVAQKLSVGRTALYMYIKSEGIEKCTFPKGVNSEKVEELFNYLMEYPQSTQDEIQQVCQLNEYQVRWVIMMNKERYRALKQRKLSPQRTQIIARYESGEYASYAAIGRSLGISRAYVSKVISKHLKDGEIHGDNRKLS